MDRRAVLALALAAACKSSSAPRDAAPPPPAPVPIDAAPRPDAEAFALFDHVPIRAVSWPLAPHRMELPDGAPPKITLAITHEGSDESDYHWPDPAKPPPWMQTHVGPTKLDDVKLESDGSWLARAGRLLVLVDRDRHPEIALDFSAITGDPHIDPDLASFAPISAIDLVGARRVGSLVIAATGASEEREAGLIGVDASTGEIAWQTRPGVGPWFVIFGGHAIASSHARGRWAIAAVALDTGAIDASVGTRHGSYRMWQTTPGEIHGAWRDTSNGEVGPPIELIVTAKTTTATDR